VSEGAVEIGSLSILPTPQVFDLVPGIDPSPTAAVACRCLLDRTLQPFEIEILVLVKVLVGRNRQEQAMNPLHRIPCDAIALPRPGFCVSDQSAAVAFRVILKLQIAPLSP